MREVGRSTRSNPLNCEMMNPNDERIQVSRGRITPWSFWGKFSSWRCTRGNDHDGKVMKKAP
jgi:hypothetical protein